MTITNAHAERLALNAPGGVWAAKLNTIAPSGFLSANAFHVQAKLNDQAVMHYTVNRGRCGQGILEDLIPF